MHTAILNYNFVMPDHPRSPLLDLKFPLKFRVDWVRTLRYRNLKILQIRLKMPIKPPKIIFWEFWPPKCYLFIIKTRKRHYLMWKHWSWWFYSMTWRWGLKYKKGKNTKVTENAPTAQTPFPLSPSTKFCVWCHMPDIFLGFKFHQDRLKNVGVIDLAHRLYNSLLLLHKTR